MWISEKHLWPIEYEMDVRGKRVLDVGAGCGESASFYLNRGAAKVSAVESDLERVSYLEKNKVRNNWNLDIIPGRFSLNHLIIPHDALKMDIEGWEIQLLKSNLDSLGLARIEIHPMFIGKERASAIVRKFGLRRVHGMVWGSP
jgi:16S rRNA A1518/A1519 N6-dimethyltransferase RsmA/KsgA/DIM1 with predicted DNA glycosylase/AP lyase activity